MSTELSSTIKNAVKHWYILLIIGALLLATGIWTFSAPQASYLALAIVFSISFLVTGILEIIFSLSNRKEMKNWGWILALGIMTTLAGVMLLKNPALSMITLPLYVGFTLMFRSFAAMGLAMDLKNNGVLEWGSLMILGVLGMLFSFMLVFNPAFGGMTIVFWTGIAFVVSGGFNIYLSFKMRNLHKNWDTISEELKAKIADVESKIREELSR